MRLANAANYFENTLLRDAYTNVALFRGSIQLDSTTGGSSLARRHALCLPPNTPVPARRALKLHNEVWVIGDPVRDMMQGTALKTNYMAVRGTDLMFVMTPGQAAIGVTTGLPTAWAQSTYLKSTVDTPTDSEYDSQYDMSFAAVEAIVKGTFLKSADGRAFHVRNTHSVVEGFLVAEADQIDVSDPVSITFATGAYDPINDTFSAASTNTTGMFIDMSKLYEYKTQSNPYIKPGDKTLVVAKSMVTPVVGKLLTIAVQDWVILSKESYNDGWMLHVRRA